MSGLADDEFVKVMHLEYVKEVWDKIVKVMNKIKKLRMPNYRHID